VKDNPLSIPFEDNGFMIVCVLYFDWSSGYKIQKVTKLSIKS